MRRFLRNPLEGFAPQLYHEPTYSAAFAKGQVNWVCDPALVSTVLQGAHHDYPKNEIELEVFRPLLGNGLLTAQGNDWRQLRHIVAPLFRRTELAGLLPGMNDVAAQTVQHWRGAPDGSSHQIDRDMSAATYRVICRTMLPGSEGLAGRPMSQLLEDYLEPFTWPIVFGFLGLPKWLPFPGKRQMSAAQRGLRARVLHVIAQRRAQLGRHEREALPDVAADSSADNPAGQADHAGDLLNRLLQARHDETGAALGDTQILDTLLTFLLAGHETTAKALTWALYLLTRAPQWQQRLADEVQAVTNGAPITADHLDQLTLVNMFAKETLRLYPPVPLLTRTVHADTQLGDLSLKAGSVLMIPTYAIHRHHDLWEDPNMFNPQRFAPDALRDIARTQFMPFGAGPRICVGAGFAMMELVCLLANFVSRFRFEADAESPAPQPVVRVTLRPANGLTLRVFRR